MDDPVAEITSIITQLCTATPNHQQEAIETYFTANASFTHPFCRTGSFKNSRWLIAQVYLWYKILSPHIDVHVDSIAFDKANMLLYVSIHQTFKIWLIPFYNAQPSLVTVLRLVHEEEPSIDRPRSYADAARAGENGHPESSRASSRSRDVAFKQRGSEDQGKKYYIQSQNDLYQTNEFIKFLIPWGIGATLVMAWQLWATFMSVIGAFLGKPVTWAADSGILKKD